MTQQETGRPWLFLHVMKAGGTRFRGHFEKSAAEALYPTQKQLRENIRPGWYLSSAEIINAVQSGQLDLSAKKIIFGHYPYVIREFFPFPTRCATFLCDPVERSLAMIDHRRLSLGEAGKEMTDLEVLEIPGFQSRQIRNYQTKVLGMSDDTDLEVNAPIRDEAVLFERAMANLEAMEFIGLTNRMEESLRLWNSLSTLPVEDPSLTEAPPPPPEPSAQLLDRVSALLDKDIRLYAHAVDVFEQKVDALVEA